MRKEALSLLSALLCLASCGPGADVPPNTAAYPPPSSLDPNTWPHAWSTFNVDAIRAHRASRRLLALVASALPDGVNIDDVAWLSVDGTGAIDESWRNIRWATLHSGDVVATRGKSQPAPPDATRPVSPPMGRIVSVRIRLPAKMLRIPFFEPPQTVEELTLSVDARDDGGADIRLVENASKPGDILDARASLERMVNRVKGTKTSAVLLDVLSQAKVSSDERSANLEVAATPEQVEAAVDLAVTLLRGP